MDLTRKVDEMAAIHTAKLPMEIKVLGSVVGTGEISVDAVMSGRERVDVFLREEDVKRALVDALREAADEIESKYVDCDRKQHGAQVHDEPHVHRRRHSPLVCGCGYLPAECRRLCGIER